TLRHKLEREPTLEELAAHMKKPLHEIERALCSNERVTSVDAPQWREGDDALVDAIADENNVDPSQLLQDENVNEVLEGWLEQLSDKQRAVVELRFGLAGHERATLEEAGKRIGVTRERVRQIQLDVLKRLREILEAEGLDEDALFR